jgi:hypothetical protein
LLLKGILQPEDWEVVREQLTIEFPTDNYFAELKDLEMQQRRLEVLALTDPYVGKYLSQQYVRKNVLKLSDEQIEEMESEMTEEAPDLEAEQDEMFDQELELQQAGTPDEAHYHESEGTSPFGQPGGNDEFGGDDEADFGMKPKAKKAPFAREGGKSDKSKGKEKGKSQPPGKSKGGKGFAK